MSVSSTIRKAGPFVGNGSQTAYPFAFKVFLTSDLSVVQSISEVETTLALGVNYTVTLNGDQEAAPGGTVNMIVAPAAGTLLTLLSSVPATQPVELTNAGGFYPEVLNDALDRLTILHQQQAEVLGRAVTVPVSSSVLPEDFLINTAMDAAAVATAAAEAAATSAEESATAAATSAAVASGSVAPVSAVSASSVVVGTGTKAFTIAAGLNWVPGMPIKAARTSDPINQFMTGTVVSYVGTTLTTSMAASTGSGTYTDWSLSLSASGGGVVPWSSVSGTPTTCAGYGLTDAAETGANIDITSLASPAIGAATATTQAANDNSTKVATTAFVNNTTQTVWIPAGAMAPNTTNGAASGTVQTSTNGVMIKTLNFDPAVPKFAQFSISMPKGWNEGTVTAEFLWSHAATTTNFGVSWRLRAFAIGDGETIDSAFGASVASVDTGGTTDAIYRSPLSGAVTIAGTPQARDTVFFELNRDATDGADTMTIDARLHGVALFYTTTSLNDA
jgi:hypothetical protein